jgi:hypothetical protein
MVLNSLPRFNKALKDAGIPTSLVKGEGYFWFIPTPDDLEFDSVMVCHYCHLSTDLWLDEFYSVMYRYLASKQNLQYNPPSLTQGAVN